MYWSKIPEHNIDQIADYLAQLQTNTFLFVGNLGAGKTTLIKLLLQKWGCTSMVSSPTYSLLNEYKDGENSPIFHADWYRINNVEELYDAGIMEYFDIPNSKFLIEWPQVGMDYIHKPYVLIEIEHQNQLRNYRVRLVEV